MPGLPEKGEAGGVCEGNSTTRSPPMGSATAPEDERPREKLIRDASGKYRGIINYWDVAVVAQRHFLYGRGDGCPTNFPCQTVELFILRMSIHEPENMV